MENKMNKIIVAGSSNTDMVAVSDKLPAAGETIIGKKFFTNPGGKGANQAVAARRLGGHVIFIAKVGHDLFGKQALETYQKEGIETQYIAREKGSVSGVAMINVDAQGENTIVVAPGANSLLNEKDIEKASESFAQAEIFLVQLEIPLETVISLSKRVSALGKKLILNPAPARALPDELLSHLYMITPNESEAESLTGIRVYDAASAHEAATKLRSRGVKVVIITLGKRGAYLHSDNISKLIPAPAVQPIDTTAAGDTFNGALAVALSEGMHLEEAVNFANRCAAISVTREGAQAAVPYRREL